MKFIISIGNRLYLRNYEIDDSNGDVIVRLTVRRREARRFNDAPHTLAKKFGGIVVAVEGETE
ncbi:hypothetical protein [Bacillus subtilis]